MPVMISCCLYPQPKLTMAKCKRNVENFIDACRRLGVPQVIVTIHNYLCCVFLALMLHDDGLLSSNPQEETFHEIIFRCFTYRKFTEVKVQ